MEDRYVVQERRKVELKKFNPRCPIVVDNIQKEYSNGKKAIKRISLAIEPGTCFGLLGVNGAGKTTLISILTGLFKPSYGKHES